MYPFNNKRKTLKNTQQLKTLPPFQTIEQTKTFLFGFGFFWKTTIWLFSRKVRKLFFLNFKNKWNHLVEIKINSVFTHGIFILSFVVSIVLYLFYFHFQFLFKIKISFFFRRRKVFIYILMYYFLLIDKLLLFLLF